MATATKKTRSPKQQAADIKAKARIKAQNDWVDTNRKAGESHLDAVRRYWAGKKK